MKLPVRAVTKEQLETVMSELTAVTKGETPILCSPDVYQYFDPGKAEDGRNPNLLAYSPVLPPLSAFALIGTEDDESDVHGFSFTIVDQVFQCCYAHAAAAYYETWQWFSERGASSEAQRFTA